MELDRQAFGLLLLGAARRHTVALAHLREKRIVQLHQASDGDLASLIHVVVLVLLLVALALLGRGWRDRGRRRRLSRSRGRRIAGLVHIEEALRTLLNRGQHAPRLLELSGREHRGQLEGGGGCLSHADLLFRLCVGARTREKG